MNRDYTGPKLRPAELVEYYSPPSSTIELQHSEQLRSAREFSVERLIFQTDVGEMKVDYYRRGESSDDLIFVFPVLGGRKNMIANYFADYFARNGFDAAIVHRDESIKKPENLDRLEDILRKSVMRDQLAIDYFEQHMGKRDFGTFGISRGGVNVAISAGVDPRLKYNIIAMGGSAIAKLFRDSDERRIRRFRESVMRDRQMSEDALFEYIDQQIRTDPKNLAQYIDARDAMVILSLFDSTVPIEYGKKLREEMGKPETIYLIADHRTSALYTQFITLLPPGPPGLCNGLFPIDYIETESVAFYDKRFGTNRGSLKHIIFSILQFPFTVVERAVRVVF